jgi:hypothetical protein
MKRILIALLFTSSLFAQELPNAPQPQQQPENVVHNYSTKFTAPSRGPKKLWALAGVVGFAVATDIYDVTETEKGLKAGVAVEGNTWLVGSKPKAGALYGRDLLVIGFTASPSVLAYVFRKPEFFFAGLGGPIVIGCKHIHGGNQWKALLAGQPPTGSELGPE